MATTLELISSAMSKINKLQAGETPAAEDVDVCIDRLNTLLGSFENENLFNYATQETIATLPANTVSRTIGSGLQINVPRPVKLLPGCFSRVQDIDYPIEVVTEQEYNDISLKSQIGAVSPSKCFYDGLTTTANVYFWPYAVTSAEIHIVTPISPGTAADQNTVFTFPPGYQRMIENNLAIEIAPDFNIAPSPMLVAMASSSKRLLKRTNSRVGQLQMGYYDQRGLVAGDIIGGNF